MSDLFDQHRAILDGAIEACATRGAWSPFNESPARRNNPDGAHERGKARFEGLLGTSFPLDGDARVGAETSPYTGAALGIDYPTVVDVDAHFDRALRGLEPWVAAGPRARVGVCLEILHRLAKDTFANAYATMHTAGQPFLTAFAGSGANSLDRGLEALAFAYRAMVDVPQSAAFARRFGADEVHLRKTYRLRPRGVALVITCASYPAWNAYPAIFANLATGNPVVVKPHPEGTLPMAMAVAIGREVLAEAGFDPDLLTLAADAPGSPLTKPLATHPRAAIVDFTGSCAFGSWLEANCRQAQVYTETAGCNAVIVESTDDLDGMIAALTMGLSLFSAQMCTAPQNIFVPQTGVKTDHGHISVAEFSARLGAAVDELAADGPRAAAICGALQSDRVLATIDAARSQGEVLHDSVPYAHPDFPAARTATPLLVQERHPHRAARREWFGPIAFVLPVPDRETAVVEAARDAREQGAIASYLYSTDDQFIADAEAALSVSGASLGVNLIHHAPINYTAAFSDYHVTGLNPAGNASLTDLAFVANRFRIVQTKREM